MTTIRSNTLHFLGLFIPRISECATVYMHIISPLLDIAAGGKDAHAH